MKCKICGNSDFEKVTKSDIRKCKSCGKKVKLKIATIRDLLPKPIERKIIASDIIDEEEIIISVYIDRDESSFIFLDCNEVSVYFSFSLFVIEMIRPWIIESESNITIEELLNLDGLKYGRTVDDLLIQLYEGIIEGSFAEEMSLSNLEKIEKKIKY